MRRFLLIAAPFALLALVLAGTALAGNGGFAPEPAHSPNARRIVDAYWLIFGFTAAIFLIVEGVLIAFVVKYRSRNRNRAAEGVQLHGHTRLELIWTVIPVLILAAIASFVFYKLPGISDVPASSKGDRLNVRVDAHQFYWQFTYPNGAVSISELHVPVNKVVYLDIHAADVIHSFWVPQLGGKTDAIPGRVNHTWFQADRIGSFEGRCAEMCGMYHAKMPISVISESPADFAAFLQQAPAQLGKMEFAGVCQTCHGIGGKGGYGPALAGNPLVQQAAAVENIVRNGRGSNRGVMPPVGSGWTHAQMQALTTYLRQHLKGSTVGG